MMRINSFRRALLWLMNFFLTRWVRLQAIVTNHDALKPTAGSHTCYVIPNESWTDALILNEHCKENKLPLPLSSTATQSDQSSASLLFLKTTEVNLLGKKAVSDHSIRELELLLSLYAQKKLQSVRFVPASVHWGRSPDKENSFWKIIFADTWTVPGLLKKTFMVFIHGRNTILQIGEPVSIDQLIDDNFSQNRRARKILRIFRVYFRRKREALVGPDLSHRRTLVEQILRTTSVSRAIADEANQGMPLYKAQVKARKYANEIAADYSYSVISAYHVTLTWLWNKLYDGVQVHHMEHVHSAVNTHEIIYVPCHRSHIDYLLLSYVIHLNGLVPPHIAAGDNLNLPVVGTILRKGGAFFMRRSFKGKPLYGEVFNEYLRHMLYKGFSIEFFIEGGRSRTGRLLHPKLGMLSMTVNNYLKDCRRPIKFIPVYFGYEKIFEGSTYINELRGLPKSRESWRDIFNSLKKIKKNFGKVHVNFGEPIDLNDMLSAQHADWRNIPAVEAGGTAWFNRVVHRLSGEIMTRINKAVVIHPINLISLIILSTQKQAINEKMLTDQLDFYQALLQNIPYSKVSVSYPATGKELLTYAESLRAVERIKHTLGDVICMRETQATLNTYFKNNILHTFILPAAVAFFIDNKRQTSTNEVVLFVSSIYPFIKKEFFLYWEEKEISQIVNEIIIELNKLGVIILSADHLSVPEESMALRKLSMLGNAIHHTVERYYITLAVINKRGSGAISTNELEHMSHLVAQKISILQELGAPEFFDKNLFKTFIETLIALKLIEVENEKIVIKQPLMNGLFSNLAKLINSEIIDVIQEMT